MIKVYVFWVALVCVFSFIFSIIFWDNITSLLIKVEAGDEFIMISDNPFIGEEGRIKIIEVRRGDDGKKWVAYYDYSYNLNGYLGSVYYCTLLHLIETGYIKIKK